MTRTLQTILLGCCLCASPALADTMVQLPPMPILHGAGDVAALVLQNPTAAAIAGRYVTTGIVFPSGRVSARHPLLIRIGATGRSAAVQMDERTHWPDGSVRTAVLTFLQPGLPAGMRAGAVLTLGGTNAGAPVSLAAFAPGLAVVDVTVGGGLRHLDVGDLLNAGTATYWLHGPLATEARVDAPIVGAMHVTVDARVYVDGSSMLDVSYENDLAFDHGGPVSYTAAIKLGSASRPMVAISNQQPFTDWHEQVWSAGAPAVNLIHDIPALESAGMVPHYPLGQGVPASTIAGEVIDPQLCMPLRPCAITPYMPTTGGRRDIGVVPLWDVYWLQTQNPQAAAFALAQADAAGSIPWHAEQSPGVPVLVTQYPNFWQDDRCPQGASGCSPMSFGATVNGTGITPDGSHMPGLSYLATLLTGSRHYADEAAAQAGYAESVVWPGVRNYHGSELVFGAGEQLRAGAWSLRELLMAALIEPDGSALQSYFAQAAQLNLKWIQQDAQLSAKGQLIGWLDATYGSGNGSWAPWQNDFAALVVEWMQQAAIPNADRALAAMTPFLVNRFLQPANVFCPYDATAYNLIMGPSSSSDYTTWSQVEQATTAARGGSPCSNPGNGWSLDYGVAATSVVGALPATASQRAAMAWIATHPAATGSNINPAWAINP